MKKKEIQEKLDSLRSQISRERDPNKKEQLIDQHRKLVNKLLR